MKRWLKSKEGQFTMAWLLCAAVGCFTTWIIWNFLVKGLIT